MAAAMDLSFPEKKLQAYYGIASIHARKGEILRAARNYKSAIAQIETTRSRLASEEHRSGFLENKIAIYEDLIDLLLRNDNLPPTRHSTDDPITAEFREYGESRAEIAFYYAESTKGRSFLESMAKGKQTFITERIPKEIADQEKKLAGTLAALEAGSVQKEEGKRGGGSRKKEIEQVKRELEEFINRLKKDYPDYAAIKYPEPVTLRDIPLKDNEVLLEFKVNPKDTYLWVVGRGTEPRLIPIPLGREELAQKIRDFREPVEQVHKLDNFDPQKGEKLFQILLEKGLGGVDKKKNIIIVPDGPLNLLPFEALTIDSSRRIKKTDPSGGASNWGEIRFLGEDYKISYYPSTSIMAVLRKAKTPAVPPKTLFALGDPIYEESDSRYREHRTGKDGAPSLQAASRSTPEKISLREVVLRSGFSIPRLPETREEVLKIGELFSSKEGGASIKLDLQARESEVKKARLSDYQYIHFATHGILSGDIPYILEPALVLTQVAESEEDGFLKTSEVLGWKLKADLVVLSACKTALGKQVAGEGIVGLSRAFMLAGAKSVVVSLWSVDSNSTAALMRQYYKNLRAGQTKEESLRLAKQELKAGDYSVHRGRDLQIVSAEEPIRLNAQHPFFWAPFILLGEWE
jgi:CHAT domain-containing protein